MEMRFVILVIALLATVQCEGPTEQEKHSLVESLNHHRVAAGNQQLAEWNDRYEAAVQELVNSCQKSQLKYSGTSEHVVKEQGADYLADSVNFWVEDGKEDEKQDCVRFACNDYHELISAHLQYIGCSYKYCPNLEGTFVACRYDFVLD